MLGYSRMSAANLTLNLSVRGGRLQFLMQREVIRTYFRIPAEKLAFRSLFYVNLPFYRTPIVYYRVPQVASGRDGLLIVGASFI